MLHKPLNSNYTLYNLRHDNRRSRSHEMGQLAWVDTSPGGRRRRTDKGACQDEGASGQRWRAALKSTFGIAHGKLKNTTQWIKDEPEGTIWMRYFLISTPCLRSPWGREICKHFTESDMSSRLNLFELYYILLRDTDERTALLALDKYYDFSIDFDIKDHPRLLNKTDLKRSNPKWQIIGYRFHRTIGHPFLTGDCQFRYAQCTVRNLKHTPVIETTKEVSMPSIAAQLILNGLIAGAIYCLPRFRSLMESPS